jgi:hypothetical protein
LGPGSETDRDPRYTSIEHSSQFEIIQRVPFLNSATSPQLTRAFYIPSQDHRNQYSSYVLLKNRHAPSPHMNSQRYKRFEEHELKDKYVRKQRRKRLMKEKLAHLKEVHTHDHVAERWPDIIDPTSVAKGEGVVVTKSGKKGWWNRGIVQKSRHLLFVYGENQRDYKEMKGSLHPTNGKLIHQGVVHKQKTTQANIRGEFNAFPLTTVWYTNLPSSDQYVNRFDRFVFVVVVVVVVVLWLCCGCVVVVLWLCCGCVLMYVLNIPWQ